MLSLRVAAPNHYPFECVSRSTNRRSKSRFNGTADGSNYRTRRLLQKERKKLYEISARIVIESPAVVGHYFRRRSNCPPWCIAREIARCSRIRDKIKNVSPFVPGRGLRAPPDLGARANWTTKMLGNFPEDPLEFRWPGALHT